VGSSASRVIRVISLLGLVGGLFAVQVFLKEPESTLLWNELFNSGHAPLYGVLSLVVLGLLDAIRPSWQRGRRYLEAFWITFFAGAIMELLQRFGAREPQIADLLRNAAGIVALLAVAASFDRDLLPTGSRGRAKKRIVLWAGAFVALGLAFVPVIVAVGALVARDRAFPVVCGFDTVWERQLLRVSEDAEIAYRKPPDAWRRGRDDLAGYVTFLAGRYPILTLNDPYPDWTGYDSLSFTVYSELSEPATVTLWVADDHHVAGDLGSFRRRLEIKPGENRFDVPLADIRTKARNRELDLTRIHKAAIYASKVEQPFSLFLDDFRLN